MHHFIYDGIIVKTNFAAEMPEIIAYIKTAKRLIGKEYSLHKVNALLGKDGKVRITFEKVRKFERIRRITGYLTGDVNSWNDAKQAELKDRMKHSL